MARTKKDLLPMDQLIAQYLREYIEESGTSYRALALKTGMSLNRIGIILRKQPPPATVGEVGRLAAALGLSGAELLMRAEREVRSSNISPLLPTSTETQTPGETDEEDRLQAERELKAAMEAKGVQRIAARSLGAASPAEIRAIARAIRGKGHEI